MEHNDVAQNVELDMEESGESQSESSEAAVRTAIQIKKHPPPVCTAWMDAFGDPNAFSRSKPNNGICKNCKQSVRHHHKLLSVKTHLKRCKPFKKLMLDKPVADRPEWWNEIMNKKKGSGSLESMCKSSSTSFSTGAQLSARSFATPVFNAS